MTGGLAEALKVNIKRAAFQIQIRRSNWCQSCRIAGSSSSSRHTLPFGRNAVFGTWMVNTNVRSGAAMNISVRYLHLAGGGSYHSPDKPRKLDYCWAVFSARLPSPLPSSGHVSRPIGVQTVEVIWEGAFPRRGWCTSINGHWKREEFLNGNNFVNQVTQILLQHVDYICLFHKQ